MLQILYNNEPLDISQTNDAELQQSSPLFGIEQSIAEFSTPITILYSDRNNRLLQHYFLELTSKTKISLPVVIYENNTFSNNATLVIETTNLHRYLSSKASLTGYLLLNISNFFNDTKDKLMSALDLGGLRSFNYTTLDPTDSSDGYWQHFQDTWNFGDDYIMVPAHNPANPAVHISAVDGVAHDNSEWMNMLADHALATYVVSVYPFIKLKYLLEHCLAENGWAADFTGIINTDWQKLILYPYSGIDVANSNTFFDDDTTPGLNVIFVPFTHVQYCLNQFVDPTVTCSTFVLQWCTRLGWAPVIDGGKKIIRFVALKDNQSFVKKDWTKYAQPATLEDYKDDPPIISYKTKYTGNDGFSSDQDITGFKVGNPVASKFSLPAVDPLYDNVIIFSEAENQYYTQVFDNDADTRTWLPYRDNIYDDAIDNSTLDIESEAGTVASYWALYGTIGDVDYYALMLYSEQSKLEAPGIRAVFFLGMSTDKKTDGTDGDNSYPFSSAINFLPGSSTPAVAWANVWKYQKGGVEYGIENYWYKPWIDATSTGATVTMDFNLPLHELVNFRWDDKILVGNVQYLAMQLNRPFPFKNTVQMVLRRLTTKAALEAQTQIIYVRKVVEIFETGVTFTQTLTSLTSGVDFTYTYTNGVRAHVYIRTFADAAGTVPLDASGLVIKIKKTIPHGVDDYVYFDNVAMIGHEIDINYNSLQFFVEYDLSAPGLPSYDQGHLTVTYDLQVDAAYTII